MRILMTADTVGGVWTYALTLAAALTADGYAEVHLAATGNPCSPDQRAAARAAGVQLHELPGKLEWMPDPWDDVAAAGDALLQLAVRIQPDIVHLNEFAHGALPWHRVAAQARVLVVAHSDVVSWWHAVHSTSPPPEWDSYRQRVRAGLEGAHAVLAPSRAMAQAVCSAYGPLPEVTVVPNGIALLRYQPAAAKSGVMAVGRVWDEGKNIRVLAAAARGLPADVRIAGEARHPATGKVQAFDNVSYLGVLPPAALAQHLGRAAVYALPAKYEPFGLSVAEAAAAGCALVLADIPSLREHWDGAARFLPPDDVAAWHHALHDLLATPTTTHHLAQAAQQRVREFGTSKFRQAYRQCYTRLRQTATHSLQPA